jgi:hypothetical protein
VVGTALVGEDVLGLAGADGLKVLLEGRLVVADGSREGVSGAKGGAEVGQGGLDDLFFDEGAGGGETSVEIEGGDDGLEGIGEEGGLAAAAAGVLSAAEAQEGAEADAGGDRGEVTAADERGAETGELTFAGVGEAEEESFGDEEPEDGVADELELLVVGGGVRQSLLVGLVGERTVGESPDEELGPLEAVVEEVWRGLEGGWVAVPGGCSSVLSWARLQRRQFDSFALFLKPVAAPTRKPGAAVLRSSKNTVAGDGSCVTRSIPLGLSPIGWMPVMPRLKPWPT